MTYFRFPAEDIVLVGVSNVQERRNTSRTKEKLNQTIAEYNKGLQTFAKNK